MDPYSSHMSYLHGMLEQKFLQVILGKTQAHISIAPTSNTHTMTSLKCCVMNLLTI
jgi:hypothetical protein